MYLYQIYLPWIITCVAHADAERWFNGPVTMKSYYTSTEPVTWSTAKIHCDIKVAKLAVIADEEDQDFIHFLLERIRSQHWIGLERGNINCTCEYSYGCGEDNGECMTCRDFWQWNDVTEMNFTRWACNRPYGGNRGCGVLKPGGHTWDATSCNNMRFYVCQYDCSAHGCRRTNCNFTENAYLCHCDPGSTGQHCDQEKWTNNAASGKSYYFNLDLKNWSDAQSACASRGSGLAVIVHDTDLTFIRELDNRSIEQNWIGLKKGDVNCGCSVSDERPCVEDSGCDRCRKSWTWVDGTEMGTYLPWTCNRPLSGNRSCGVIKPSAMHWDATSCRNTRQSVCQYNCSPSGCGRTECTMKNNIYSCECENGFTGQHCDEDINECDCTPCHNGAACLNKVNGYTCMCLNGYTGLDCENEIDECEPDPCINAIECIDQINGFTCVCKHGYTGKLCDAEIDECDSKPCQHDGLCIDGIGGYECNCTGKYEGTNCQSGMENLATSREEKDDKSGQDAFYAGVALLAVTFIGMIITIVIFIKTQPRASPPEVSSGQEETENGVVSADENTFDGI